MVNLGIVLGSETWAMSDMGIKRVGDGRGRH